MCNEKWETFRATFQCHNVILNPRASVFFLHCTFQTKMFREIGIPWAMKKGISCIGQDLKSHSGQKKADAI